MAQLKECRKKSGPPRGQEIIASMIPYNCMLSDSFLCVQPLSKTSRVPEGGTRCDYCLRSQSEGKASQLVTLKARERA